MTTSQKILIVGAGAFGTAIACSISSPRHHIHILGRSATNFDRIAVNPHIAGHPVTFSTFDTFHEPLHSFHFIILAIPCQSLREVLILLHKKDNSAHDTPLTFLSLAKGIEQNTLLFPSQIIADVFKENAHVGVLSGPSFAREMQAGLPTALVMAAKEKTTLNTMANILHSKRLHIYKTPDVMGVEVGGALKNIIAMISGVVDGLELGHNAQAAVMTRGLSEIANIGVTLGANPLTFMGLSGLGDLILTGTGELSRNRKFGKLMAQGVAAEQIMATIGGVIEGVSTTQSAYHLCKSLEIDAPLIRIAYQVLYQKLSLSRAMLSFLEQHQKEEFNWITHGTT